MGGECRTRLTGTMCRTNRPRWTKNTQRAGAANALARGRPSAGTTACRALTSKKCSSVMDLCLDEGLQRGMRRMWIRQDQRYEIVGELSRGHMAWSLRCVCLPHSQRPVAFGPLCPQSSIRSQVNTDQKVNESLSGIAITTRAARLGRIISEVFHKHETEQTQATTVVCL